MKRRGIRKLIKQFEIWSGCDAAQFVDHYPRRGIVDHFKSYKRIRRIKLELKREFYSAMDYYYSRGY